MRFAFVLAMPALLLTLSPACGDDEEPDNWSHFGGNAGSDASAGTGGAAGGSSAGASGSAGLAGGGGQTQGGAAGQAGAAPQGGAAGSAQGGAAGAGQGGAAGYQCGEPPGGSAASPGAGPCSFPQGVPDEGFYAWSCLKTDTDPAVDAAVNAVMATLSGCGAGSDCDITGFGGTTNVNDTCQSWFAAVTEQLRAQGYCAGQHAVGSTDEIAVSNTGCTGKWYGYHICNYGGPKVVWNPGARRPWWMIEAQYCP